MPALKPVPLRGRHATAPDRLHLTGLTPDQRRLIVALVREIRATNGYPTRRDALAAAKAVTR